MHLSEPDALRARVRLDTSVGRDKIMKGRWVVWFALTLASTVSIACPQDVFEVGNQQLPGSWQLGCSPEVDDIGLTSCVWRTEVREDLRLASKRRLVVLQSSHVTGSGSRDQVSVYSFETGKIVAVLQQEYPGGAFIHERAPDKLVIRSGAWMEGDASCCPSKERYDTYVWSPKQRQFILGGTVFKPRKDE